LLDSMLQGGGQQAGAEEAEGMPVGAGAAGSRRSAGVMAKAACHMWQRNSYALGSGAL
jgi:hypothetical protein